MFGYMGKLICRAPAAILALFLALTVLGGMYSLDVMRRLTLAPGLEVPGSGSAEVLQRNRERLGMDTTLVLLLFSPRGNAAIQVDDPDYRSAAEAVLAGVAVSPDVRSAHGYYSSNDRHFVSRNGRETYAVLELARGRDEGVGALERLRPLLCSPLLKVELGGELPTYVDTREQLEKDLHKAEIISFVSLAVLLVWVFGSLVAALLPLIVSAVTVILSLAMLKALTPFMEISVYSANVATMLGLGLAVDYGLYMLSRFREELSRHDGADSSLCATLVTAGRTIMYSGFTVALSLACLFLLPQRFFQNMGLAGAISVGMAMLASIILLPALLVLLGRRVNRCTLPWLERVTQRRESGEGWYRFSHFVMRHARLVLAATLTLLALLGLPALHLKVGLADYRSLPEGAESRRVIEAMQTEFPLTGLDPIVVVAQTGKAVRETDSIAAIDALTRAISALPGAKRVVGLTTLDAKLTTSDYQMLYANAEQFPIAAQALEAHARGDHSKLYVFYDATAQSEQARHLVRQIRALPTPPGMVAFHVGGLPAFHLDYLASLRDGVPRTIAAIVVVIFVLLFLMLGSLFVPFKVVLTNLLSLSATYGVLVLIFQDGYLAGLLGFTPPGSLEGTVLVLIFASAFGLSIDYEVFLLSRVKEACVATGGDNLHAVSIGVQRSGPIITNAAMLIAIVLGAFALGEVVLIKQMGLGLLVAVIVDATIVRMLLVPASLRLMGRFNWWAPKPLLAIYERLNLGEASSQPTGKTP